MLLLHQDSCRLYVSRFFSSSGSDKMHNICAPHQIYKLFIIVELLMGDIPERSVFRQPVFKKALLPYLQIVQGELSSSQCT